MSLIGILMTISIIVPFIVFIAVFPIPALFMAAKSWILREPMPEPEEMPMVAWLNRLTFKWNSIDYVDYFASTVVVCIVLFVGMAAASVTICFPIPRLLIGGILAGIGIMHALRWMFDTGRSLKKIKDIAHNHGKKEE